MIFSGQRTSVDYYWKNLVHQWLGWFNLTLARLLLIYVSYLIRVNDGVGLCPLEYGLEHQREHHPDRGCPDLQGNRIPGMNELFKIGENNMKNMYKSYKKQLVLKKKTVANLSRLQLGALRGGAARKTDDLAVVNQSNECASQATGCGMYETMFKCTDDISMKNDYIGDILR